MHSISLMKPTPSKPLTGRSNTFRTRRFGASKGSKCGWLLAAILGLCLGFQSHAQTPRGAETFAVSRSVRLAWDYARPELVSKYRVYFRKGSKLWKWFDGSTVQTATVSGLERNTRYSFRVTAFWGDRESVPSGEVRYNVPK